MTTKVLFLGKYDFSVLPLSWQSAICSCLCRTCRFLTSVLTTQITTLAQDTQQIMKFLAIYPVRCHVWHSEDLLHWSTLQFMAAIASRFCAIVATHVLASTTSSELYGRASMHPHTQISHVYFMTSHTIKCTRLSPSLAVRAWEWG